VDSSGNALNGLYSGTVGTPTPSSSVPPVAFSDPFSRAFSYLNEQGVKLAGAPASLKPTNGMTIALFYRAMRTDTNGAELVSMGDTYNLRLSTTQIEWNKYVTAAKYVHCFAPVATYLDGNWHHLAAVSTTAGMKVYFDGGEVCSNAEGGDILYNKGLDFWVGRHGTLKPQYDFDGNLDEVRIYGRALSVQEILALAHGAGSDVADAGTDAPVDTPDAGSADASEESAETPDATAGTDATVCAPGSFGANCQACPSCGNGTCNDGVNGDGTCVCSTGWAGAGCTDCAAGYWGSSCAPCLSCVHGTCNDGFAGNGACTCAVGWAGSNCDICAAGFFGASCQACPSCGNGTCNDGMGGTGTCTCNSGWAGAGCTDCAPGHWGNTCQPCPTCSSGVCNDGYDGNGACSCAIGWMGANCDTCAPGYFGPTCQACPSCGQGTCSDGLGGNGACTCAVGWTGASCDTCAPGYFGPSCQACPSCGNGTCSDGIGGSGSCTCAPGWTGASCDTCAAGYWGPSCQACSCKHGTCNPDDGHCSSCNGAWTGADCDTCTTCQTGLVLYWKFDETSGNTALDSSPNGFNGTYVSDLLVDGGTALLPAPSANVPAAIGAAGFSDPMSLLLTGGPATTTYRQAVKHVPVGTTLKPANNLTVAAWFRSTTTDNNGSEILSMGDYYLLRLKKTTPNYQIQFTKYTGSFADCMGPQVPSTVFMDGNWHHFAGIASSTTGMSIYLDGAQVFAPIEGGVSACSNPASAANVTNLSYPSTRNFWVGRNGNTSTAYDYDGNVDEVRVYNRALTPGEILSLAQGAL
jgi:hypothetical protein